MHNANPTPDQRARAERTLARLLADQPFGVLATHRAGQPYCSLVGIAAEPDYAALLLATERDSQKFRNLQGDPRAAVLIDNRSNRPSDFQQAAAVTAIGAIEELSKDARGDLLEIYVNRQPNLAEFARSRSCALLRLAVDRYVVVTRFQDVVEYVPRT